MTTFNGHLGIIIVIKKTNLLMTIVYPTVTIASPVLTDDMLEADSLKPETSLGASSPQGLNIRK